MSKPHLIATELTVHEGQGVTALCGKRVLRAEFVAAWDDKLLPGMFDGVYAAGVCAKCMRVEIPEGRRYIYAVVSRKVKQDG